MTERDARHELGPGARPAKTCSGPGSLLTLCPHFRVADTSFFHLEGRLGGSAVSAGWDGRILSVTDSLWAVVALADAVEAAFAEAGLPHEPPSDLLRESPGWALVVLARACDELSLVEYQGRTRMQRLV